MDPDPDPEGPKTRGSGGSGSATLVITSLDVDRVVSERLRYLNSCSRGWSQPAHVKVILALGHINLLNRKKCYHLSVPNKGTEQAEKVA
jgi:hypothetical protein